LRADALRICVDSPPTSTSSPVPALRGIIISQNEVGPVTPEGARPEGQFFTVPTLYLNSVTLSSII
jgi:hypothetical protein